MLLMWWEVGAAASMPRQKPEVGLPFLFLPARATLEGVLDQGSRRSNGADNGLKMPPSGNALPLRACSVPQPARRAATPFPYSPFFMSLFRTLIAGGAAYKFGGGCISTVLIFILVFWLLGQC
jgi:hypothetical protein